MIRAALTGGIATGKSHVLAAFARLGVPTIDADTLAHGAIAAGTPGAAAVVARFGTSIRLADGSIDRRALGAIVFNDVAARRDLEAIVHPAVYGAIDRWFRSQTRRHRPGGGRHPAPVRDGPRGRLRRGDRGRVLAGGAASAADGARSAVGRRRAVPHRRAAGDRGEGARARTTWCGRRERPTRRRGRSESIIAGRRPAAT